MRRTVERLHMQKQNKNCVVFLNKNISNKASGYTSCNLKSLFPTQLSNNMKYIFLPYDAC